MFLKLKNHKNWKVSKLGMSLNLNVTKKNVTYTQTSLYWNVTKTEISLKLKCHYNWNLTTI